MSILFSFSQAQTKILGYAMQNQQEQMQQKTKAKKEYKANDCLPLFLSHIFYTLHSQN